MSREDRELLNRALEHGKGSAFGQWEEVSAPPAPKEPPAQEPEYFPEVKLELPREEPAQVPSLDQLWQEEDTVPVRRQAAREAAPRERREAGKREEPSAAKAAPPVGGGAAPEGSCGGPFRLPPERRCRRPDHHRNRRGG